MQFNALESIRNIKRPFFMTSSVKNKRYLFIERNRKRKQKENTLIKKIIIFGWICFYCFRIQNISLFSEVSMTSLTAIDVWKVSECREILLRRTKLIIINVFSVWILLPREISQEKSKTSIKFMPWFEIIKFDFTQKVITIDRFVEKTNFWVRWKKFDNNAKR